MKSKHKGLIASGKMSGAEEKKPKLSLEDMAGMLSNEDEDDVSQESDNPQQKEWVDGRFGAGKGKGENPDWEGSQGEEEVNEMLDGDSEEEEDEGVEEYSPHMARGHLYGGHKMPHITVVIQHGDSKKTMKR